jgi:plastocyanin
MIFRRAIALPLTLAVFSLAACGGDGSDSDSTAAGGDAAAPSEGGAANAPAPSGEAERSAKVEIVDFAYAPATVTVQAGGKVIWLNQDATEHTATLDDGSFSTGDLAEGKLKSESFKAAGTYAYHCEIHPEMKGTVEVVEPS